MRKQITLSLASTLLGAALLLAGAPAHAQGARPQPGGAGGADRRAQFMAQMQPDKILARMDQQLDLSPDQEKKIKPILADMVKQLGALVNDTKTPDSAKRGKFMKLQETTQVKVDKILTPAQKKKVEAQRAEIRKRMEEMRARQGGAPGAPRK